MSKRKVMSSDVNVSDLKMGDRIVLEDGTVATITVAEDRDIEVVQKKKVRYLSYESPDKKGRKVLYYSVHMDDDVVEMVDRPLELWNNFKKGLSFFVPTVFRGKG